MSFIEELKRRNVLRSLLTYGVAAWVLIEAMELLTGAFEAPSWVLKVFIGVVALGFLPVIILSWVYEITPDGIRKDGSSDTAQAKRGGHKLNIVIVLLLFVAIGLFFIGMTDDTAPDADTDNIVARVDDGPPMLAVLPFASTSIGADSEFFATGVHDDLLTQLAQLQSIRVISRTSVLEYKDTVRNMREIGKALGADAILEGGVQIAGNMIRINA